MSQLHACVSQGPIYLDGCICCYTKTEDAGQSCCLTQLSYTYTRPMSPSTDSVVPDWVAA